MTLSVEAAVAARRFDVSLSLGPAETIAVLGPNGAGKSTLLSVIAGLLRPDSGRAEVDGRVLFDLPLGARHGAGSWTAPHRRGIALLAQEPLLFPHLSALENVAFGPRGAGVRKTAARDAARRWLAEVDAGHLESRRPGELSGGPGREPGRAAAG
jgi:molybdate transport system ATP-binding protein